MQLRARRALTAFLLRRSSATQRKVLQVASVVRDRPSVLLPGSSRTVVVVAHPDDEAIMCGGTIRRLVDSGAEVTLVVATDGESSKSPRGTSDQVGALRIGDLEVSAALLGIARLERLRLPDGSLGDHEAELVAKLRVLVADVDPDVVITSWPYDGHRDHEAVGRAVMELDLADDVVVLGGEIWRPVEPDLLVDVTDVIDVKRAAINAHSTAGEVLRLDAALGLTQYRSFQFTDGHGWLEAFTNLRT